MTRRPRISTVVLLAAFAGMVALYLIVRPAPAYRSAPSANRRPPVRLVPSPSPSPRPRQVTPSHTATPTTATPAPTTSRPAGSATPSTGSSSPSASP